MYCKDCRYRLARWQSCCPECGRAFDPSDPRTYLKWSQRGMSRATIIMV